MKVQWGIRKCQKIGGYTWNMGQRIKERIKKYSEWKWFSNQNNKNRCAKIDGFPTVMLFKDGNEIPFNGQRTINALYEFFNNN